MDENEQWDEKPNSNISRKWMKMDENPNV